MKSNIQLTVETTYENMQKEVKKILSDRGVTKQPLIFSIFDSLNSSGREWKINVGDFNSVFCEGKVVFSQEWDDIFYKSEVVNNPTLKDIIFYANQYLIQTGDFHVFLESVEFKEEKDGIKIFEFWFGS